MLRRLLPLIALALITAMPAQADTQADRAATIATLSNSFPDTGGPFAEEESARRIILIDGCDMTILTYHHNLYAASTRALVLTTDLRGVVFETDSSGRAYDIEPMVFPEGFTMGVIAFATPQGTVSSERHNITTDMSPAQILAQPPVNTFPETQWRFEVQTSPAEAEMVALADALTTYQADYCAPAP